jgi:general secretion pathway protein D
VLLMAGTHLQAQSIRPGGNSRGTTGGSSGSRAGSGGFTGGGNRTGGTGSNGQHQYRSNTELGDATIQIDPETRSIIVVTDEETHAELEKVITDLDRPKPQVMIKVVFLEVSYNKDLDLGVEANYTFNNGYPTGAITGTSTNQTTYNKTTGTAASGSTTVNNTTTKNTDLSAAAVLANGVTGANMFGLANSTNPYVRIIADDWTATIHALSRRGKVEVLSRPSIMARNNQEAVIVVGSEVPFITSSRIDNNNNTINTIQYDNVGIILRVTPFITSKNSVEMIVAPEISALTDQTVPISNTASAPVISKRSAETVVVTPNARTVVIGGLMETQHISSVQKVPLLGDIPYVGFAFRRTIKSDVKRELMIFLTPYIVENPAALESLSHYEVNNTELVDKAFNKTEFDRFIDGGSLYPDRDGSNATDHKVTTTVRMSDKPRATPAPTAVVPASAAPAPAPKAKSSKSTQPANPKGG